MSGRAGTLIPFLAYRVVIRRIVYTTNMVESVDYQMRKATKSLEHFSHDAHYSNCYGSSARSSNHTGSRCWDLHPMRGESPQHLANTPNILSILKHYPSNSNFRNRNYTVNQTSSADPVALEGQHKFQL